MNTPRILALQEISTAGASGLTTSIPVLSSMNVQVCPLPLSVSSLSRAYGTGAAADLAAHGTAFLDSLQSANLTFDAIYSSTVPSAAAVQVVADAINRFKTDSTLVIVDPVLGDKGTRYDDVTEETVTAMQQLISSATVMTPNLTEACLLTGIPYDQVASFALPGNMLQMGCSMLADMGPDKVVVTDIPTEEDLFKVISYDKTTNEYHETTALRLDVSACGMGDVFTSALTGYLLQGASLGDAADKAMTFTVQALQQTKKDGTDSKDGVRFLPFLSKL